MLLLCHSSPSRHNFLCCRFIILFSTPIDGILEGYLTLIDIELPDAKAGGLVSAGNNNELPPYEEVQGVFCHISWDLQRNDPTSVPLFQDLQRQSTLCEATMFTADLRDVTEKARAYDNGEKLNFAATRPKHATQSIDPAAVIFSESKSGSVLISNVLAAFRPERTRVYTEAPPVTSALLACRQLENQQAMIQNEQGAKTKDEFCPGPAHHALIRDVFYLLGRNANPVKPQYVFYKINSLATTVIQDFVHAMPNANWVFSYRDPVEVLMSHFQHYLRNEPMPKNHMPTCLQNYGQIRQSELFEELVRQKDRTVASLTKVEFCAVHLATLCHAAVEEYKRTNNAKHKRTSSTNAAYWFIDHKELPYAVWEQILSKVANVHLTLDQVDHMQAVAKVHTKGSGSTQKVWKEDSIFKQSKAPPEVQEAANTWLYPIYRSMDKIRQDLEQKFSSGRT